MNSTAKLRPYNFKRLFRQPISQSVYDMRSLLKQRPDTEHELTANRLILSSTFLIYLVIAHLAGSSSATEALRISALPALAFEAMAAGLFLHILLVPGVSHARRLIGIVADLGLFSFGMHISGEAGATFILVYFWAVLGNGFRFGVFYLAVAAITALASFGIVYLTTPFWQSQSSLSIGLALALVVIPAYTSTLIRKLSEAKQEAEEASRAKSLFLASMSHELRTPLNAIIGLADLLEAGRMKREQQDMVRVIGRSGRSLLSLIETVLDFARIEAGQLTIRAEEIEVAALMHDVRAMIGVSARKKGLRFVLNLQPGTPERVMADRRHLEEIMLNLASNATKFTEKGHIRLDVGFKAKGDEHGDLLVDVVDTGIGIDASAHGRIFERFTQADGSIMDRFGGTGLGLAIVRQLVRAMGGDISVASEPGKGSAFSFHLPVEVVSAEETEQVQLSEFTLLTQRHVDDPALGDIPAFSSLDRVAERVAAFQKKGLLRPIVLIDSALQEPDVVEAAQQLLTQPDAPEEPILVLLGQSEKLSRDLLREYFLTAVPERMPDGRFLSQLAALGGSAASAEERKEVRGRSFRILIADDNKTNQMVIAKTLESGGHQFEVVENGEAAVERMLDGNLDLVLMDVNMPVMNGIEATKFYKFASLGMKPIPVVGFTADATGEARERCLSAGMVECLTKPIEPRRLLDEIDRLLEDAEPEAISQDAADLRIEEGVAAIDQPVIDQTTTEALAKLGGDDFVNALLGQFIDDSADAMKALAHAVADEDVGGFRNSAHALRSAAANVGAMRIYQMCLDWREIADRDLSEKGEFHLHELTSEIERFREELNARQRLAS